jgi:hypothetical protein
MALVLGALLTIGVGVYLGFGGQWFGWLLAGFGLLDLASVPFLVRRIEGQRTVDGPDPDYNPYARED